VNAYVALSGGGVNAPHLSDIQYSTCMQVESPPVADGLIPHVSDKVACSQFIYSPGDCAPHRAPYQACSLRSIACLSIVSGPELLVRNELIASLRAKERFSRRKKPTCTHLASSERSGPVRDRRHRSYKAFPMRVHQLQFSLPAPLRYNATMSKCVIVGASLAAHAYIG
jgi:hypothetical protein